MGSNLFWLFLFSFRRIKHALLYFCLVYLETHSGEKEKEKNLPIRFDYFDWFGLQLPFWSILRFFLFLSRCFISLSPTLFEFLFFLKTETPTNKRNKPKKIIEKEREGKGKEGGREGGVEKEKHLNIKTACQVHQSRPK